jgi:hypothetical protein
MGKSDRTVRIHVLREAGKGIEMGVIAGNVDVDVSLTRDDVRALIADLEAAESTWDSGSAANVKKEPADFQNGLRELINRHSMEAASDTPDFVLAEFLKSCLTAFNESVVKRAEFHERGRHAREGESWGEGGFTKGREPRLPEVRPLADGGAVGCRPQVQAQGRRCARGRRQVREVPRVVLFLGDRSMEIIVDVLKDGDVPIYDKDGNRAAIVVSDDDAAILVDDGIRVEVPMGVVSGKRLRAMAYAIDVAVGEGRFSAALIVSGQKIGFVST